MAQELSDESFAVEVVSDLQVACQEADLISCATRSTTPLIQGRWIQPGTHIDLVGGHAPEMREADENLICKARVFVDSFEAASLEAGDLIQPIRNGVFTWDEVEGDLFDLVQRESPARKSSHEITLFKSVGTAIEDLIAGRLLIGGDPL
jgi:ornithine cyclodeaminase